MNAPLGIITGRKTNGGVADAKQATVTRSRVATEVATGMEKDGYYGRFGKLAARKSLIIDASGTSGHVNLGLIIRWS